MIQFDAVHKRFPDVFSLPPAAIARRIHPCATSS